MKLDKNILKLINEVYNEFDFLNNDEMIEENKIKSLLNEKFFQKQFIVDSISYIDEKIEVNDIDFTMKEIKDNINIGYSSDITYKYNDDVLEFILNIGSLNLFETALFKNEKNLLIENDINLNIKWSELPVRLITKDGEQFELTALYDESKEIREEFIKIYLGDLVKNNDITYNDDEYNSPPLY
jgi:hypothetical protein